MSSDPPDDPNIPDLRAQIARGLADAAKLIAEQPKLMEEQRKLMDAQLRQMAEQAARVERDRSIILWQAMQAALIGAAFVLVIFLVTLGTRWALG